MGEERTDDVGKHNESSAFIYHHHLSFNYDSNNAY
jgi:hypothetical protein